MKGNYTKPALMTRAKYKDGANDEYDEENNRKHLFELSLYASY